MKYKSLQDIIGNTPVIELKRYSPKKGVRILAKLEGSNPGGSVKDRIALFMMKHAQKMGLLTRDRTIIEPTSGNTGIGLAFIAAVSGLKFTAVIPDNASLERQKILKAYGAQLILTEGAKGTNFAIETAKKMASADPSYLLLDQFNNPANVSAHYHTTAPEIIREVPDITHFVAGMGSGGTLMGVGKKLKEYRKTVYLIGIEPKPGSKIAGLRNMSAYTPSIYLEKNLDRKLTVSDEVAFTLAKDIFKKEGISVGISSGAALWGAMETAKTLKRGTIVTVFPDRGDRYVSTELFN